MNNLNFFPDSSEVSNKTILLRLDLNVPMKGKTIQDDTRIVLCLPFIKKLIERNAKIIIISHLGRPKGKKNLDLSLNPVYKYLKKKLGSNVYFFMGNLDKEIKNKLSYQKAGDVILFENIRFFNEEEQNDDEFSKKLASLCDVYINDAFSCSHREQASIHKITKFVKSSFAGPLIKKEINALNYIVKDRKKPVTCIIGGSKISTKINVINSLVKMVDNLVIVGAMANNFLAHKGYDIGSSLIEKNTNEIMVKIISEAKENDCELFIPEDCKVGLEFSGQGNIKQINEIESKEIILDIGKKTIEGICNKIDNSQTVLWNGPAGYFENENFQEGTFSIAKKISDNTKKNSLISVLGGGDTLAAINKINEKLSFTHLSTAGGAFLEYLEGKDLPGLSVLK